MIEISVRGLCIPLDVRLSRVLSVCRVRDGRIRDAVGKVILTSLLHTLVLVRRWRVPSVSTTTRVEATHKVLASAVGCRRWATSTIIRWYSLPLLTDSRRRVTVQTVRVGSGVSIRIATRTVPIRERLLHVTSVYITIPVEMLARVRHLCFRFVIGVPVGASITSAVVPVIATAATAVVRRLCRRERLLTGCRVVMRCPSPLPWISGCIKVGIPNSWFAWAPIAAGGIGTA